MQVICVVLNKVEYLDQLLKSLKEVGVTGGTIIDSTGMIKSLDESNEKFLLESLRLFLENPLPDSKTIFFIVHNEQVEVVRETVDNVMGGIHNRNTGIVFGIPISFVDGMIDEKKM